MVAVKDKKSGIEYKIDDLRERIDLLEDMEEKRVLLFSAFGSISILVGLMGGIFIISSSKIDPYDIPALYTISSLFFLGGLFMLWKGLSKDNVTHQLIIMKEKLSQFENMVFMSEVGNINKEF